MAIRKSSLTFAAFALLASSTCLAAETYKISASLSQNGKSLGDPVAVVQADTPASVEVSGPNGYKLGFLTIRSSRARFAASCKFLQVSLAQGRKAVRLNSGVRSYD
jgi:hypothetical protein